MRGLKEMEENVSRRKKRDPRFFVLLAGLLALSGGGLLLLGINSLKNNSIEASVVTPPVPSDPSAQTSITPVVPPAPTRTTTATSVPPVPPVPTRTPVYPPTPGELIISPGWSMLDSSQLSGDNFSSVLTAGIFVFSYNDPNLPNTTSGWTVYSKQGLSSIGGIKNLHAIDPLGYWVFNPTSSDLRVTISPAKATSNKNIIPGWHLVKWPGDAASKNDLYSKISFKYSDGTIISAQDAQSSKYHRISMKVFAILNEHSIGSEAVKEVTGVDSQTTVSKVPADSFIWIFTRRAGPILTQIMIDNGTTDGEISAQEKSKIDLWLTQNGLDKCGDKPGTVAYAGGSCLFNESTGITLDKYIYLSGKYPDKPWNKTCLLDVEGTKLRNSPFPCMCPEGMAYQIVREGTSCAPNLPANQCNPPQFFKCIAPTT